jgi:hypothetical protein
MSGPNYDDYDADAEECINWQLNYLSQGKSRAVLIAWLTARPQDANLIVHDILKFLPTEQNILQKIKTHSVQCKKKRSTKCVKLGIF